jgi:O-antigen ligase
MRAQYIFEWFIVGLLGKKLSFTGRVTVWDKAIEYIIDKPLLGYGYESSEIFTSKMGSIYYTHAHNTMLDICYKGGIISGVLFLMMLYSLNDVIKKCQAKKVANMISIILFCCLIMMIFEARQEKMALYVILAIAASAESIGSVIAAGIKKDERRKKH